MRPDAPGLQRFDPGLERTQRWMQALIVAPGSCDEAIRTRQARKEVAVADAGRMALPSKTLTAEERIDIYRGMYEARLGEALAADYPGIADFLGEDRFQELVTLYVARHPSRSYTLNTFGDAMPEFIRSEVEGLDRPEFLYDLARLELAQTHAFDAEETPPLTQERIAAVPAEKWERARLIPIAALRLLELRYPVHKYLDSMRQETARPAMRPKRTHMAVFRRDYAVSWIELTPAGYALLEALVNGSTLGEAIAASKLTTPAKQKLLYTWFQQWTGSGLFRDVVC